MGKLKEFFKDKRVGFYFAFIVALSSIAAAIVYTSMIHGNELIWPEEYEQRVFLLPLLGGIFALALLGVSLLLGAFWQKDGEKAKVIQRLPANIASWLVLGFNLIALLILAPSALNIIMRLSMARTPMESVNISRLVPVIVMLVLSILLAIASVFLPLYRREKTTAAIKPNSQNS